MNTAPPPVSAPVFVLALLAAALLAACTGLALRPRALERSFVWIALAGTAYPMLALAAGLHSGLLEGLSSVGLQLLAVLLAAGLLASVSSKPEQAPASSGGALPAAGRAIGWLALVGLPPTIGFHGKVIVYRMLLAAGWEWLLMLALAGSAAALLPGLWSIRLPQPGCVRGVRRLVAAALIVVVVVLGIYPEPGLALCRLLGSLVIAT